MRFRSLTLLTLAVTIATVAVLSAPSSSTAQTYSGWTSFICDSGGGSGELHAYGEYRDSEGKMHWVDMDNYTGSYLGEWTATESGNHVDGAFGPAGQHSVSGSLFNRFQHFWQTDTMANQVDDPNWDLHWEHAHNFAYDLKNNLCGYPDF